MNKQLLLLLSIFHTTAYGYAPSITRLAQKFVRMKPAGKFYKGSKGFNYKNYQQQPSCEQAGTFGSKTTIKQSQAVSKATITTRPTTSKTSIAGNPQPPMTYKSKAEALRAQKHNQLVQDSTKAFLQHQEQTVQNSKLFQSLQPKSMIAHGSDQLTFQAACNKSQAYTGNISAGTLLAVASTGAGLAIYSQNPEAVEEKALTFYEKIKQNYNAYQKESDVAYFESLSDLEKTKALNQAIVSNDKESMYLLLQAGANPTTGLALAVQKNNVKATTLFLYVGANLPELTPVVKTPLTWSQYFSSFFVTQVQAESKRSAAEQLIELYTSQETELQQRAAAFQEYIQEQSEERKKMQTLENFYDQSLELADASVSLETLVEGTKILAPIIAQATVEKTSEILAATKESVLTTMKNTTMEPNFGLWS
jgi:hypothetical protein